MLPSRGFTRNPASALRYSLSSRAKPTRTLSTRQFSQAQSQSSVLSRRGLSRTSTSHYGQITPSISAVGYGAPIGIASGVFAQRSGAARNLSLWPFQSKKPQTPEPLPELSEFKPDEAPPPVDEPSTLSASAESTSSISSSSFAAAPPADFPDLSELDDAFAHDIPERIGYLHELGLDFGWGPTTCCEWLIEHIYVWGGLPWWATIAAAGILFRAVMFYPTLAGAKHQAILAKVHASPAFARAKEASNQATYARDAAAIMAARADMKRLMLASGASPWRAFANFAMVPFTFGMFRLLRNMAGIPVPGLETGGLAWFTDLTVADPYFILPSISIAVTVLVFNQTQRANLTITPMQKMMMKGMTYVLPPLMFLGTAWLPAGVQWFFLVLSAGTAVQTKATITPAVRRWAQLPPLPTRRDTPPVADAKSVAGAPSSVQYQSPSSLANLRGSLEQGVSAASKSLKEATGATEEKTRWRRADDYEARRAREDAEKAERRMEEVRRRRAEKQR
ncbi:hypothetical protein GGS24DRAFT_485023 [Hypoxylon argillaceum]|nr:hypothetical protein GGS24DRAFT_485023 [Hypoxylon argillaceum]